MCSVLNTKITQILLCSLFLCLGFSSESYGTDNLLDQSVELGKSYSCVEPRTVSTGLATVMLWDMNLQPFAEEADGNFGEGNHYY